MTPPKHQKDTKGRRSDVGDCDVLADVSKNNLANCAFGRICEYRLAVLSVVAIIIIDVIISTTISVIIIHI